MNRPGCNVEHDWEVPVGAERLPNGTTRYEPKQELTLLHEFMRFPDCVPTYMHGGGKPQPWAVPFYGINAEVELANLLYAFVRLLRPKLVLETGTFHGFTTYALARACRDNGMGEVISCEIDPQMYAVAKPKVEGLPCKLLLVSATSPEMDEWYSQADFAFLDADENTRPYSYSRLKPGCFTVIHDTNQEPWAVELPDQKERIDVTETWKGFTMMRKR